MFCFSDLGAQTDTLKFDANKMRVTQFVYNGYNLFSLTIQSICHEQTLDKINFE